jgi:PTH1 family peptidyl-tRNA hydrolase
MAIELVLGLGNPGRGYAQTRHNVGFMVADLLRRQCGVGGWLDGSGCELVIVPMGRLVTVARFLGYMNRSGTAAELLLHDFGLEPSQLLVLADDVDLPLGRLRMRKRGGPGTHNGLRDICAHVGEEFVRLRIGVSPSEPVADLAEYVLSPFGEAEQEPVQRALQRAADAVRCAARSGVERAMNVYNRAPGS